MGFTNPYPAGRLTVDSTNSLGTGLLLWAPLTEGTGTTADCIVHAGHTGTQSGGVSWASDSIGSVASFDGVDDYFDFGTFSSYFPGPSITGSLSAWVKWFSGRGIIIGNQVTGNERFYIGVELAGANNQASGLWSFGFGNYAWNNGITGTRASAVSSEWAHVVLSISSGVAKLYVNGTETITKTDTSVSLGGQFTVGAYLNANGFALGTTNRIQNVRIYDRALSATEVTTLYHRPWEGSNYGNIWPYSPPASAAMTLSTDTAATSLMTNCVGWWPLTTGSGTTAKDVVGTNDGTLTNVDWLDSELGMSSDFQTEVGGDHITTSFSAAGQSEITVSFWMRNDGGATPNTYGRLLSMGFLNALDCFINKSSNNSLSFAVNSTNAYFSSLPPIGEWFHFCGVWSQSSRQELYINGSQVATATADTSVIGSGSHNVIIGGTTSGPRTFHGGIQNVRIWDRALSSDEVAVLADRPWEGIEYGDTFHYDPPAPASMLPLTSDSINTDQELWLPLTDGSSTTAVDISGGGNDGTLDAALTHVNTAKGAAVSFPANGGIDSDATISSQPYSVSLWGYMNSATTYYYQMFIGQTSGSRPTIYIDNSSLLKMYGGSNTLSSTTTIGVGEWFHVVGVFDGSSSALYVNGVVEASGAVGPYDLSGGMRIGHWWTGGRDFDGNIQNVRVWSRALSATEVADIYYSPWLGSAYTGTSSDPATNRFFSPATFARLG